MNNTRAEKLRKDFVRNQMTDTPPKTFEEWLDCYCEYFGETLAIYVMNQPSENRETIIEDIKMAIRKDVPIGDKYVDKYTPKPPHPGEKILF
jgi:hypothetical protein